MLLLFKLNQILNLNVIVGEVKKPNIFCWVKNCTVTRSNTRRGLEDLEDLGGVKNLRGGFRGGAGGGQHPPGDSRVGGASPPLICSPPTVPPPGYWHASYLIRNNLNPYQYDWERRQFCLLIEYIIQNLSQIYFVYQKSLNQMFITCLFEYKTTFWICIFVVWIQKGFYVVKKLVWNVCIKTF